MKFFKILIFLLITLIFFAKPRNILADYCSITDVNFTKKDGTMVSETEIFYKNLGYKEDIDLNLKIRIDNYDKDVPYSVYITTKGQDSGIRGYTQNISPPHSNEMAIKLSNVNSWPIVPDSYQIIVARNPNSPLKNVCDAYDFVVVRFTDPTPTGTLNSCYITINPTQPKDTDLIKIIGYANRPADKFTIYVGDKEIDRSRQPGKKSSFETQTYLSYGDSTIRLDVVELGDWLQDIGRISCPQKIHVCNQFEYENNKSLFCGFILPTSTITLTPTPNVSPTITPTPPFWCQDNDSECNQLPVDCSRRCSECPICKFPTPTPRTRGKLAVDIPNLKPLCDQLTNENNFSNLCWQCQREGGIWSAIGCLPTDFSQLLKKYVFTTGIGLAGGISFIYFLYGAFKILTSRGNAEMVEEAKQIITSSLAGLILIIFSVFLLRTIGVDILQLPGFK